MALHDEESCGVACASHGDEGATDRFDKVSLFVKVIGSNPFRLLVPPNLSFSQYCDLAQTTYIKLVAPTEPVFLKPRRVLRFAKDGSMFMEFELQGGGQPAPTDLAESLAVHVSAEPLETDKNTLLVPSPSGRKGFLFTARPIPTRCTVNRLVLVLTDPMRTSEYAQAVLLLNFPTFMRPEQLLEKLMQRYGVSVPAGLHGAEKLMFVAQRRIPIRRCCVRIILRWLRSYPEDFTVAMARRVQALADALTHTGQPAMAEELRGVLDELGPVSTGGADAPAFRPREIVPSMASLPQLRGDQRGAAIQSSAAPGFLQPGSAQPECALAQRLEAPAASGPGIPAMSLFGFLDEAPLETGGGESLHVASPFLAQGARGFPAPPPGAHPPDDNEVDAVLTTPRPVRPLAFHISSLDRKGADKDKAAALKAPTLLELPPRVLADHVAFFLSEAYMHVHPRELLGQRQSKLSKRPELRAQIPHFALLIDRHNALSRWASRAILEGHETLVTRMEALTQTAACLRAMRHYEAMVAIVSALNSAPVNRVPEAKAFSEGSSQTAKQLRELVALLDVMDNLGAYRREWESIGVTEPCVPYTGVSLRRITLTEESLDACDGPLVNFSRCAHLYNSIYYFLRHQLGPQHTFFIRPELLEELLSAGPTDPNELWEMSYTIAPRPEAP
eukprot:gnl/Chilomastix_cuspidata/4086.p1 GENE.gnl/Chilomastix_cuspidata/4086~~gnl/Chilomastix_cuspidata/4086.p1  ORF type:complete len:673 (-),score=288.52 gnl/Chilomastix_cuspidata/4086:8-2026(-)